MHTLFRPLATAYLRVDDSYALINASIALATQHQHLLCPWLQQALQAMCTHNQTLGTHLKDASRQQHTQLLHEVQPQRVRYWASVRRRVRYYLLEGNTLQQQHAHTLHLLLQPYRRLDRQALPTQTALIGQLMVRYKQETALMLAVKGLDMMGLMAQLEATNNRFGLLYEQRNQLAAARPHTNSQLRAQSMAAYGAFCKLLQQVCLYSQDSELLAPLVAELNALRAQYQLLAKPRKHYKQCAPTVAQAAPTEQEAVAPAHPTATLSAGTQAPSTTPTEQAMWAHQAPIHYPKPIGSLPTHHTGIAPKPPRAYPPTPYYPQAAAFDQKTLSLYLPN